MSAPVVLPMSSASASGLAAQARQLRHLLVESPGRSTSALARSWALRPAGRYRAVVVADTREGCVRALESLLDGHPNASVRHGASKGPVRPLFMFPGIGSQ